MRLLKATTPVPEDWTTDTINRFMVSATANHIYLAGGGTDVGTPQEALNLAAWLLCLAMMELPGTTDENWQKFFLLFQRIQE